MDTDSINPANAGKDFALACIPRKKTRKQIPDNQEELLETTIGMMMDNDISVEMEIVFNNVPFEAGCKCKASCQRKCQCREKNVRCNDTCGCKPRICKNQMEQSSVNLESLNIHPVLSDHGSSENLSAVCEDESECDQEFSDPPERQFCECLGSCYRGCLCKSNGNFCVPTECFCNNQKCKNHEGKKKMYQSNQQSKRLNPIDLENYQRQRTQNAKEESQNFCTSMMTENVVSLLSIMSELSPSTWQLAKSIYERSQKVTAVLHSPKTSPPWCICFKCEVMPNEKENVCCKNKDKNHEHPEFYHLVLDERVLDLAMKGNADWLCFNFNPDDNSSWRYTAYRQYTMWHWGHLGRGNRKVILACIVEIVRERFPDKFGNYRGFLDNFQRLQCSTYMSTLHHYLKCKKCFYFRSMVHQCIKFLNH